MQRQKVRRAELNRYDDDIVAQRHELDNGCCQSVGCYAYGSVHHIIPKRSGGTTHRYTIDELVTLCIKHHSDIHDRGLIVVLRDGRSISIRGVIG